MANTTLSNTQIDWLSSKWRPVANAEFEVFHIYGRMKTVTENFNADQIEGALAIDLLHKHQSHHVIVAWKENGSDLTVTANNILTGFGD